MVSLCVCYSGHWGGQVPSYQLRFADGYEPERVYWDDNDPGFSTMSHKPSRTPQQLVH